AWAAALYLLRRREDPGAVGVTAFSSGVLLLVLLLLGVVHAAVAPLCRMVGFFGLAVARGRPSRPQGLGRVARVFASRSRRGRAGPSLPFRVTFRSPSRGRTSEGRDGRSDTRLRGDEPPAPAGPGRGPPGLRAALRPLPGLPPPGRRPAPRPEAAGPGGPLRR